LLFKGKTATAIIPFQKNKILLIKRLTPPFAGYWALPGGRSEPKETADQTIIREVKEETGLDVIITNKIGEYHEKGIQAGLKYDYYPTCFLVQPIGGELKKQDSEIQEIQLFNLDTLPSVMAFEHYKMVKDYQEKKLKNSFF
jgi:ADP-ribose pyrophosphatase YjhB (NUDIX family)